MVDGITFGTAWLKPAKQDYTYQKLDRSGPKPVWVTKTAKKGSTPLSRGDPSVRGWSAAKKLYSGKTIEQVRDMVRGWNQKSPYRPSGGGGGGGGGTPTVGGGGRGLTHSVDLSDPFDPRLQAVDISGTQPNLPTLGSKGGGGKGGEPKQPPSTGGTNKLSGGKGGRTTQPPSTDMGAALRAPFAQSVYDRSMFLLRPELDREQARIDANIANRGLAPTSQAARGLQGMFADQRSRRLNDLATGATLAGSQEQQRLANLYLAADAQRFGQGSFNQQQRLAEQIARAQQQLALRGLQQQGTGMRAQQQLGLGGLNLQTGAQQFGQQMALRNQQIQEALMRRQQPIQDLGSLLAATQGLPTMPQFTQTALAAPDYMGLLGSVYGARAGRPSGKGGTLSGIGGLLTGASQAAGLFSDRRTKENIRRIGTADNSLPIYAFNYRGDGRTMLGFMADEVEKVHPEAVGEIGGLKTVNYALATRPVEEAAPW